MCIKTLRLMTLGACLLAFTCIAQAQAAPASTSIPLKDFARRAMIHDPAMSPDGKYLALRMDDADGAHHAVVVFSLADMKRVSILRMPIYQLPLDINWVSPTRLVLELGQTYGPVDKPHNLGEIISSDFDGTHQKFLYGYDAKGARVQSRGQDEGIAFISNVPFHSDGHFAMRVLPFGGGEVSSVYDVNAVHNTRHLLADIPVDDMDFMVRDDKPLYAFGINNDMQYVAYRMIDGRWNKMSRAQTGQWFEPISFNADHSKIYAYYSPDGGPKQLIEQNTDGKDRHTLMADPFFNFNDPQYTPHPYVPFAIFPSTGVPKPIYLNPNLPVAKLYMALNKAFAGQHVEFLNYSDDGKKLLFGTTSDRNPGTYYIIDRTSNKVTKLFDVEPWINPAQMSQRVPFRFKTSDGLELEGILTFPLGRRKNHLPMVLLPHGGPISVRDSWSYDQDAQLLASRGYLVLQVNFRGSSGRGVAFEQAGYRKWGTRIQQDLTDGVKWTIAHNYADPQRICVYGASFGGYSALMQVIREPHLYKCAVGYAGVYDLDMLLHKGNAQEYSVSRNQVRVILGDDKATLDAQSPVNLVDKIDVPVFLVHGKDDHQAPYDGAVEMHDALEKAGKSVQWMAVPGEGHGFYKESNNIKLFTKLFAFLKQNIGPGAPVMNNAQAAR